MEYDAVFYEAFEKEEKALKKFLPGGYKYLFTWKTIAESGHQEVPAPIVSTRTQSQYPLQWKTGIKAILTRSTGYDHVTAYRQEIGRPIPAAYLPDYAARAVAEQALLLWSALLRNLTEQQQAFKTFYRDGLTGREIRGRTIAVIGVGRIGSQIVDIAHGLGLRVLGVDLEPKPELAAQYALQYVSLPEAVTTCDIAVCALPLTEITRGLLDYDLLARMKRGAVFINIARGEISPSRDLLRLLKEQVLGGIALDVYDYEKELAAILRDGARLEDLDHQARESVGAILQLMTMTKVILTPHNAFNTEESVERKSQHTADNIRAYLETGKFLTPVPL